MDKGIVKYKIKYFILPDKRIVHIAFSKFGVWMHLEMVECHIPFLGHCDLDLTSFLD